MLRLLTPLLALLLCRCSTMRVTGDSTAPQSSPPTTSGPPSESAAPANCPRATSLDRDAIAAELSCLLTAYVQLDTTNPPGAETRTATFLKELLARDGIASTLLAEDPQRSNLVARLPGKRGTGAIVLMHHMDVVPANAEEWTHPPLSGTVADGYVWGRGTLDNKGPGLVEIMATLLFKRLAITPAHDIVVLAVADEEAGGGLGSHWLLEQHRALFDDVKFVLNEGGIIAPPSDGAPGGARIEVAQKSPLWLEVTAHGPSGHGSTPKPEAASHRLISALNRLLAHPFPVQVVPAVQAAFAAKADSMPGEDRVAYADLAAALTDEPFRSRFLADPHNAALVRNTLSITMLSASDKENVFSPTASAMLDMRLLPGEDPQAVLAEVQRVIADPHIDLTPRLSFSAPASPSSGPLFDAVRALVAERYPGLSVSANVIGGFTDCSAFRAAGIACYGFLPLSLPPAAFAGFHGKDERVELEALVTAVLNLYRLLELVPS